MATSLALFQQRLNLHNASFTRIDHADAMVAIVYKVTQPNGTSLILKTCARPNDYLREVYFLQYFAGKLPVPNIKQVVPPEPGHPGAILMECLPSTLLQANDLTDALAYELGSLLARIHSNRLAGYGDLTQPHDLSPDPRAYFTPKYEEGFTECRGHLPQALLDQCGRYYDSHLNLLDSVDGPCIIHRDFRPGNVLVSKGKIEGLIDWASARASFAQEDFCPIEHGEWPLNPTSKKSLLAGYASIRPVPVYTDMMRLLRLGRALATLGFTVKSGTWNSTHATVYQANRRFLEQFLTV